jgi:hypothetical protein
MYEMNSYRLLQTFGNPKRIISDRGSAFTSNDFSSYCSDENIEHITTTTGTPRANGQVERVNQCILPILTKASNEHPNKWYKHVPYIQQALNSTFHQSIATTPFRLMFGTDMASKINSNITKLIEEDIRSQFTLERDDERDAAKNQILKMNAENKHHYNKKRKEATTYGTNDIVAIRRTQFIHNKIANKYLGPYRVTNVKPNNTYDVMKLTEGEGPAKTSTTADSMKKWPRTANMQSGRM